METIETDILVAGGGIAGLAAAARLAATGRRVVVVDPAPEIAGGGEDRRTTAFLMPSVETLRRAGAWAPMQAAGAMLRTMRIVDAGGERRAPRETADFAASEIQDSPFGWNVPNTAARATLRERVAELPNAELLAGRAVTDFLARDAHALIRLSDGRVVRALLAVAADGRDSTLRRLAGIEATRWRYGQKALVFCVTHPEPHGNVSTEIHRSGGPLTLVPMPDIEGRPASAVVWMVPGPRAERFAALGEAALASELTAETMGLFGPLGIAGPRAVWPIVSQVAHRMRGQRLAVMGEAAHVIPPIGAQGLNMSLGDVECLARLVEGAGAGDIGTDSLLAAYERRRMPEVCARVAGVDVLNRFAQAEPQPIRDIRLAGLRAISRITPVRRLAMRLGLGAAG
jgi:2-octaprenyl-6-methoxyphenol hydroxylase